MVAWVSKAYYTPIPVIRQLKLVYHVTMGTNSWGVTMPSLLRPRLQGGLVVPARIISDAPSSSTIREPPESTPQIS